MALVTSTTLMWCLDIANVTLFAELSHGLEKKHLFLQVMLNFLKEFETKLGIKITCSQETEPLGTAGPLALARDKLIDDSGEPFFVLNSDVISEYPFKEIIEFHKSHGGEASIMVTKVNLNPYISCYQLFLDFSF